MRKGTELIAFGSTRLGSLASPAVMPIIFSLNEGWEGQMAIKLKAGNVTGGVEQVQILWKRFFPDKPFEYNFLDNEFDKTFYRISNGRFYCLEAYTQQCNQ